MKVILRYIKRQFFFLHPKTYKQHGAVIRGGGPTYLWFPYRQFAPVEREAISPLRNADPQYRHIKGM